MNSEQSEPYPSSRNAAGRELTVELPTYELLQSRISKISTDSKNFYYCRCQKKGSFFFYGIVLIITEELSKVETILSYCEEKNIYFSLKDLKLLNKAKGGLELLVIGKCVLSENSNVLSLFFKTSDEKSWTIEFESIEARNKWRALLEGQKYKLQSRIAEMKELNEKKAHKKKKEKRKEAQSKEQVSLVAQQHQTYLQNQDVNSFFNSHLKVLRNTLEHLLRETSIDQSDIPIYINDKLYQFQGSFRALGAQLNQIEQNSESLLQESAERVALLESEEQQLQAKLNQSFQKSSQLETTCEQQQRRIEALQLTNELLKSQHEKQVQVLQETNSQLQQSLKELEDGRLFASSIHLAETERYKEDIKNSTQQLQSQQKLLEERTAAFEEQLRHLTSSLEQSNSTVEEQKRALATLRCEFEEDQLLHIFEGEILRRDRPHKEYLKSQIEEFTHRKIRETRVIYQPDPHNRTNFHLYIDNHADIVLIVKTATGQLIAGYSEDPVTSNAIVPRNNGLLLSLTNQHVFYLHEGRRSVTYDDYYLIFGNSELRIKSQEQRIFSNFSIANAYFNPKGHKVDVLLGDAGNREVDMEHFEVHQVFFSD